MSDPPKHIALLVPEVAQLATLFPGYEVEALIATGGMGAVYRALQKSLDRAVAIKILPHELSKDMAFRTGFEAEAKAMARLNHPNLIGVYDFGEVNGMLFIIMEYVPGKSLFHSAHGIAIDPDEVIRLVTGICNGLAHAHENGIIHRDIKPSNILLDLSAQPKIGDFGLARPIEIKTLEGEEIFGSPHYTAPEVVNSPHSVDQRADLFSVGILLHELLTGRLPAEDPRPASEIVHCDQRFDAIIRRATNPLPELRYSSAAEIAKDLNTIAASIGPQVVRANPAAKAPLRQSPRAGMRPPTTSIVRKKSSDISGIFMLLVALAIIGVSYLLISNRKKLPTIVITEVIPAPSGLPPANPVTTTPEPEPRPDPVPDSSEEPPPEPSPLSETQPAPEPMPTTGQEPSSPETKPTLFPEPADPTPTEPKFDVPAFFARARAIMRQRATPLIASHDESLKKNLEEYERSIKRLIRKIEWRQEQDDTEVILKDYIEECEQDGNRIPTKLSGNLSFMEGMISVHDEVLEKQEAIDEALVGSLSQLSSTYILGLEKQIERLKKDNDPSAVSLIEEEITKTRTDENHFADLMLQRVE